MDPFAPRYHPADPVQSPRPLNCDEKRTKINKKRQGLAYLKNISMTTKEYQEYLPT